MSLPNDWWQVFSGVPLPVQILFLLVMTVALSTVISAVVLAINAARVRRRHSSTAFNTASESDYLWVFLVPALNEEVTIADSVQRLRASTATNRLIMVINDGSDDETAAILRDLAGPDLQVLTRIPPQARVGKAAALNDAYQVLLSSILPSPEFSSWSPSQVIIGIVDADGRLDSAAPQFIARHFDAPAIGGVQVLVRIYNVSGYLTWAQNLEFSIGGVLFQSGRTAWGTANMGGNGQFNRLSALHDVADAAGPWRDCLTEDQDLGVRLIHKGWRGAQENSTSMNQQGLSSLTRLYRQRTRWAQGSWQALPLLRDAPSAKLGWVAAIDHVYYLLTPVLQVLTGVGLVTAVTVSVTRDIDFIPSYVLVLVFFLTLGFAPGIIAMAHLGRGWSGVLTAIPYSLAFLLYSWLLFPVLVHSLIRQLRGQRSWAKTAREPLEEGQTAPPTH